MATTPSPSPSPTVIQVNPDEPSAIDIINQISPAGVAVIALAVLLVLSAAILISWAVLKAATLPAPTALITSLSLLTLFATAGGIATNNDAAWTIAAAGVGALAASVTNLFREVRYTEGGRTAVPIEMHPQHQQEQDALRSTGEAEVDYDGDGR